MKILIDFEPRPSIEEVRLRNLEDVKLYILDFSLFISKALCFISFPEHVINSEVSSAASIL
jgi:hypothetical protein